MEEGEEDPGKNLVERWGRRRDAPLSEEEGGGGVVEWKELSSPRPLQCCSDRNASFAAFCAPWGLPVGWEPRVFPPYLWALLVIITPSSNTHPTPTRAKIIIIRGDNPVFGTASAQRLKGLWA